MWGCELNEATQPMNETSNICIETPDAEKDIEKNPPEMQDSSSDIEQNLSDVERNLLDVEKNNTSPPTSTFDVDRWKVKRKRTQIVFCWVAGCLGMEHSMTFATMWMYLKDLVKTDDAGNIFSFSLLILILGACNNYVTLKFTFLTPSPSSRSITLTSSNLKRDVTIPKLPPSFQ